MRKVRINNNVIGIPNRISDLKFDVDIGVSGIPILTESQKRYLQNQDKLPDDYLDIGNWNGDEFVPDNGSIPITSGGDYFSIMFSAIRKLQSEVARLKNSFYYGLQSEINGTTTSSHIIEDTEEEESEPLWAIDPEDLTEIEDLEVEINDKHMLVNSNNVSYIPNTNYLTINSIGARQQITIPDVYLALPKYACYFIVEPTDLDDYSIVLNFGDEQSINLNQIAYNTQKFSVLFIRSKRVTSEDLVYNKNFYWISISDQDGNPILQKYIKFEDDDFLLQDSEYDQNAIIDITSIYFKNVKLYKLRHYVKGQSFCNESNIIPERPVTDDFIFKPAHITIRSVSSYALLEQVKDRLLNNELIWVEDDEDESKIGLYIKSKNEIKSIGAYGGSGGNTDNPPVVNRWKFGDKFPIRFGSSQSVPQWKFGDKFPIRFGTQIINNSWKFGDTFPIILN